MKRTARWHWSEKGMLIDRHEHVTDDEFRAAAAAVAQLNLADTPWVSVTIDFEDGANPMQGTWE